MPRKPGRLAACLLEGGSQVEVRPLVMKTVPFFLRGTFKTSQSKFAGNSKGSTRAR